MFRISPVPVAALLALAGAAGCGSAYPPAAPTPEARPYTGPPVPLRVEAPFFVPGEEMHWELSLHGIVGGAAVMAMGQPGQFEGRQVIIVRSRVATTGVAKLIKTVRDDITTWVDLESSFPIHISGDLKFGKRETHVETRFRADGSGFDTEYQRRGKEPRTRDQKMPARAAVYDVHAVLGAIRSWTAEDGTRAYFYGVGGRRIWHNTIRFTGREAIKTRMGLFPAIRIDGVAVRLTGRLAVDKRKKPRSYTAWISDDANRVPLLLTAETEYGNVRAELVAYDRPKHTRLARRR